MRFRSLVLPALIAVGALCAGGCTGSSTTADPPASPASPTGSPLPEGPVRFVPGEFEVLISNVAVDLTWDGGTGTMTVENGSAQELGAPSVTAITNEPAEVEATVDGADSVAVGESQSYEVTFPDSLHPGDAGLLLLAFGGDSWGAFSPVVAG
jgi:hypothetical protein